VRLNPILCLCLCLAMAACSKSQATKLKQDTQAVGHDVAGDVRSVGDNPDLKAAGNQLKAAGQDVGHDLHKAGDDIGHHTEAAANKTRDAVNQ
jgi:hypothetical protein